MSSRRTLVRLALALSTLLTSMSAQAQSAGLDADKVVSLAAEHNPALKSSLLQLESARWDVIGLEARYTPVLVLDASATQTSTPNLFLDTTSLNRIRRADSGAELRKHLVWGTDLTFRVATYVLVTKSNVSIGPPAGQFGPGYGMLAKLTLKQPLLRGRGRDLAEADLRVSRAQRTVEERTRDRVASELVRDSLTAYWELWYADAAVRIEEQARDVAQKQRDEASARANVGALAPADVLSFDTQVATREESLLGARTLRQQRELELLTQLGLAQARPSFVINDQDVPIAPGIARETALRLALAESAELKTLEAQVGLARIQSKTAGDPLRPRLDLDSYVQAQGLGNKSVSDSGQQLVNMDAISGFVGLTYELPLSDRNQRAQAAKARLAVEVAEEQVQLAKNRIAADVGLMLERQTTGELKVALAERTLDIAQKQLQAEQARFQTGTSTSLTVLVAEDAVRSAKIRVARARADLVESALGLQHMTGELLTRYAEVARQ